MKTYVYYRGGQTAAFRTIACGSLSSPKNYIFVFSITKFRNIVK